MSWVALGGSAIAAGGAFAASQSSKGGQEIRQAPTQTPEQADVLRNLIGTLFPGSLFPDKTGVAALGKDILTTPSFQGQRLAPFSPLQQQGFDLAGQIPQQLGQAQQTGTNALEGLISGQGPATEQATRFFEDVVSPNILGTFAQTGSANSGGAQRALSEAGRDLSLGLQSQIAGQQLNAIPQLPQFAGLTGQAATQLSTFGGLQQAQEQEQLNILQQIFREQQPIFSPGFNAAAQLAGLPTFENIGLTTPPGTGRQLAGAGIGALGTALSGGGGFKGLFGGT